MAKTKTVIHLPGMITSTYAAQCVRCGAERTLGPIALGLDREKSATYLQHVLREEGWRHRRAMNGDGETSDRPYWHCELCAEIT